MKKFSHYTRSVPAALLACGMLLPLLFFGCNTAKKDAVVPPMRMSALPTEGCLDSNVPTSIKEAIEKSDAVALVRVGDWRGDSATKMMTLFDAEVIEAVSGELPQRFTLLQEGSSDFTFRDHPLFTSGNELFLFLQRIPDDIDKDFYGYPADSYKITGTYLTVMDIVTLGGEKYALPRSYALLETMPDTVKNLAQSDKVLLQNAVDELKRNDSVWNEVGTVHEHLYKVDELVAMVKAG